MKNESVKKSLENSENVLEEKRKTVRQKICIKKTNTFTIIPTNFVQEQKKELSAQKSGHGKVLPREVTGWVADSTIKNGNLILD